MSSAARILTRRQEDVGKPASPTPGQWPPLLRTSLAALPSAAPVLPCFAIALLPVFRVVVPVLVEISPDTTFYLICNHSKLRRDFLSRPLEDIDQLLGGRHVLGRILEKNQGVSRAIYSSAGPPDPMNVLQRGVEGIDDNMRDIRDVQPPTHDIGCYQDAQAALPKAVQDRQAPLLRAPAVHAVCRHAFFPELVRQAVSEELIVDKYHDFCLRRC
mmetsp:Transcript_124573/g.338384  ORF Transcript_124573/g.338384 Transcript_124573/m.338384 type:complete len:215 (-) Transcript_124573:1076-1720(-)